MAICPTCQHTNPDEARYCSNCGTRLRDGHCRLDGHDEGERRHCSVMFCDLVGSSALSEECGPERYRTLISLVHDTGSAVIERYGGEILQYLGDGLLVVFGYPHAHEDDAIRAVRAGLALQAAVRVCAMDSPRAPGFSRPLQTRAAIHTGLVVVGELGLGRQRTVLAHGDTVNIAARLQQLAPPDGLLISDATRRRVDDRFAVEPLGALRLAGIRTAVEGFRVSGPASPMFDRLRSPVPASPRFVGRREELNTLTGWWRRADDGPTQVGIISGEAGFGKSRLLAAFRASLHPETRWLELRGARDNQSSELRPFLQLVYEEVLTDADAALLRERLELAFSLPGIDPVTAAALVADRLPIASTGLVAPPMLPDEQRRRLLNAAQAWLLHQCNESPVVLACEDLQWFDPTTLEWLGTLPAQGGSARLLVLGTCRTPFLPPWPPTEHHHRLTLDKLSPSEALQLVESTSGSQLPRPDVLQEILEKGGGVPLFLEQVAQFLTNAPEGARVPATLQHLLSARLDQLPDDTAATLRVCAVLGRRTTVDLLQAVAGASVETVTRDLERLVTAGILTAVDGGYTFTHALLQEAAYDRLLDAVRRELHAGIAATLDARFPQLAETQPEVVAYHLSQAGAHAAAREAWTRAGTRHLLHGAHTEAVHHFRDALAALDRDRTSITDPRDRAQLQLRLRKDLGVSLVATQGYASPAVTENYTHALDCCRAIDGGDADIPLHVLYGLWGTYLVRGDLQATSELTRLFERWRQSPQPMERHIACATLGVHAFYRGHFKRALALCEEAMALFEPGLHWDLLREYGYEGGLYPQSYAACLLCFMGRSDEGLALVERAIAVAEAIGDPYALALTLGLATSLARERREPQRVIAFADKLIALATDHSFYFWLGIAHCFRGWAAVMQGELAGVEQVRSGLQLWGITGASIPGTYLRRNLIEVLLATGERAEAFAEIERGRAICQSTLECYQEPEYHRLLGEWCAANNDISAAATHLERAWETASVDDAVLVQLRTALTAARFGIRLGGEAPAQRLHGVIGRLDSASLPDVLDARALA